MKKKEDNLLAMRHSLAHVMMQALENLYKAIPGVGPAIEDGFYHDFDSQKQITEDNLLKIEKEMRSIIKQDLEIKKTVMPIDEGIGFLQKKGYSLTKELAEDLKKAGETEISFYAQGNFINMCKGPHIESTGKINADAFKLTKIAGAYWKGDEKNKMIQRIYGVAFENKKDLDEYLNMLAEAEKRDHRKIGKEQELFSFHEEGPGFPFFKPKGMIIWNELMQYWKNVHNRFAYQEVKTPVMLSRKLWEISGHWENYRENMYESKIDDTEFAIKPMNCPGGMLIFHEENHSYRELPLRWAEIGLVHRHELSGVLAGLFRVRSFHQDDAHIFMTETDIKQEILGVLQLADEVYSTFGLSYHLELSTRPKKSIGTDNEWQAATKGLQEALESSGKKYVVNEGDGAFYGPKIDIHIKDAIGRTWQCGTIQLDMNLPERFDLNYIASSGEKKRPVMIHRVIYGSIERFFGILIEHYAGNWPVWLSPVQVKFVAVSEKHIDYCNTIADEFRAKNIRVEVDMSNETVGNKIRKAVLEKVPYMLVIGDKEMASENLIVRDRGSKETREVAKEDFIKEITDKITDKK